MDYVQEKKEDFLNIRVFVFIDYNFYIQYRKQILMLNLYV